VELDIFYFQMPSSKGDQRHFGPPGLFKLPGMDFLRSRNEKIQYKNMLLLRKEGRFGYLLIHQVFFCLNFGSQRGFDPNFGPFGKKVHQAPLPS
jgi:hypothetical protein